MPINVGLRGRVSTAWQGHPRLGQALSLWQGGSSVEGVDDTTPPYLWLGAGLGLLASPPELMQYLPAFIWLGAPGQAWMPGPGGKSF